jgi:1,4-dihydroxy-2-naphthoate octaprenyltransferase
MRDIVNDRNSGKITIPVRIGARNARLYHLAMISAGWIFALLFSLKQFHSLWQLLFLISFPFFVRDLRNIFHIQNEKELDPFLKRLALCTLAFTLLFCLGLIISVK